MLTFTFYPSSNWYWIYRPRRDARLSWLSGWLKSSAVVGCHHFHLGYHPSQRASPPYGKVILLDDSGTQVWKTCISLKLENFAADFLCNFVACVTFRVADSCNKLCNLGRNKTLLCFSTTCCGSAKRWLCWSKSPQKSNLTLALGCYTVFHQPGTRFSKDLKII